MKNNKKFGIKSWIIFVFIIVFLISGCVIKETEQGYLINCPQDKEFEEGQFNQTYDYLVTFSYEQGRTNITTTIRKVCNLLQKQQQDISTKTEFVFCRSDNLTYYNKYINGKLVENVSLGECEQGFISRGSSSIFYNGELK